MNKTTISVLRDKQSLSLDEKIEYTKERIKEFVDFVDGKAYVSFSGGLDSRVLLDIARSVYPDIKAVFCNTTNEDPEIIKFVKTIDNVITLYPKMKFKEVVEKYGFPLVSKKVSRSITDLRNPHKDNPNIRNLYVNGFNRKNNYAPSWKLPKKWYFLADKEVTKFNITSVCCDILKKEPIERFNKESGLFPIVGTTTSESQDRELNYIKYGCNILDSKKPKSRPLSIWTNTDVWEYVKKYNLSYCSLYDDSILNDGTIINAESRTGCVACGMGCHLEKNSRFESLKQRNPKHFRNIMNFTNNGITFDIALDHVLNINSEYKTKEYKQKVFINLNDDLKDCHVVCRDG